MASTSYGMVIDLLTSVDCNVLAVSELGYRAMSQPDSQLAMGLSILLTIYVAVFGLRLLLGFAPLRVGDLTISALKIGLVLALATSWPTYHRLVFDTLFRGPEQLAAGMMGTIQAPSSALHGNPFDGLQIAYDRLQFAASFFARTSTSTASPFTGGQPFAAFSLNFGSFLMLFSTLGVILAAKVVLGLLLALGPLFVAFMLFDSTRGVFEGWLRAVVAFALVPLFATLALVIQLTLLGPYLSALAQMRTTGEPNITAASAAFILIVIASGVSAAGLVAIFITALGFRLPWRAVAVPAVSPMPVFAPAMAPALSSTALAPAFEPRIAAITAAAASMDRREARGLEAGGAPARFTLGANPDASSDLGRGASDMLYRRSAQPRRAASSTRRDK